MCGTVILRFGTNDTGGGDQRRNAVQGYFPPNSTSYLRMQQTKYRGMARKEYFSNDT